MISWRVQKRIESLGIGAFLTLFIAGTSVNAVPNVYTVGVTAFSRGLD